MIRTQIQLPNELYEKAKRFSSEREMSLAEIVRRSLEQFLDRYPSERSRERKPWVLTSFDGGETLVPLENMKDIVHDEEAFRSLHLEGDDD